MPTATAAPSILAVMLSAVDYTAAVANGSLSLRKGSRARFAFDCYAHAVAIRAARLARTSC